MADYLHRIVAPADSARPFIAVSRSLCSECHWIARFWPTIMAREQLKRLKVREKAKFKSFKITAEDCLNRQRMPLYVRAVADKLACTNNRYSRRLLVPPNDRRLARIMVLGMLFDRIDAALRQPNSGPALRRW